MTPAESLPPLDAGYYLATHPTYSPGVFELTDKHGWVSDTADKIPDPRLAGWNLTPVATIEKLAEERDRLAQQVGALTKERDAVRILFCAKTRTIDYDSWVAAMGERNRLEHDRDKALADLVAVRAELEQTRRERDKWESNSHFHNRTAWDLTAQLDAARAELARLRMEQDGTCSAEELRQVRAEREKLQAFKDFVHRRLDEIGIASHPDGEHSKAGCRIGDRLDIIQASRASMSETMVEVMRERDTARADLARVREALAGMRRKHDVCEDPWYSCPKSGECANDLAGDDCTCGADFTNAKIDAALATTPPTRSAPC